MELTTKRLNQKPYFIYFDVDVSDSNRYSSFQHNHTHKKSEQSVTLNIYTDLGKKRKEIRTQSNLSVSGAFERCCHRLHNDVRLRMYDCRKKLRNCITRFGITFRVKQIPTKTFCTHSYILYIYKYKTHTIYAIRHRTHVYDNVAAELKIRPNEQLNE